tara:strand:- start:379 stop:864 length:486 start_codon:yes stop_codon:yes gene_type:complete
MSKLNLNQYRNAMFADRGTDINAALSYALSVASASPETLTAVYVVLNTVINAVEEHAEPLGREEPAAPAESVATAVVISDAVRQWLRANAGDMVTDWCADHAACMVTEWCSDSASDTIQDWCTDNASDTVDSWMENSANDMIADMVTDKVEGMKFTVTASY